MSPRDATPGSSRSGITLTEVLISIMIMGVGLISLATLFPLGLVRLRAAARDSRSTLLAESAIDEIQTRNLLDPRSFVNPYDVPWYASGADYATATGIPNYAPNAVSYDPWAEDTLAYTPPSTIKAGAVARGFGVGLPVCYDPLWRAATPNPSGGLNGFGIYPGFSSSPEARFACGVDTVRAKPDGLNPAAGLQRITNFDVVYPSRVRNIRAGVLPAAWVSSDNLLAQIFTSTDDVVFNSVENAKSPGAPSPLLPDQVIDLSGNSASTPPIGDWMFSWFFTGQRADVSNSTLYQGDIVICHNRPFLLEPPVTGAAAQASGERVVEAVWGYGGTLPGGVPAGYPLGGDRSVLLRWPSTHPDPDVRVGGWIADVTYERTVTGQLNHLANSDALYAATGGNSPYYLAQRCNWYQVVKTTPAESEIGGATPAPNTPAGYRRMIVTVNTSLRARTLYLAGSPAAPDPNQVEAALIMPSVVNVFPKSFTAR